MIACDPNGRQMLVCDGLLCLMAGKVPAHHGTIGREEGEWVWVRVPFDE